ncbi:hypothetical protein R1flu_000487 [Riccia fluitans]|uniref:Glycosyltransferase family 92 protein n=1 Tax=Riccia fluitans TaxID=41844 RepID=A0ABD1Y3R5_9MARC
MMMSKFITPSVPPAYTGSFWRLVAVIFTISFISQTIFFATLAQFTQYQICGNELSSSSPYDVVRDYESAAPNFQTASSVIENIAQLEATVNSTVPVATAVPVVNCSCSKTGEDAHDRGEQTPEPKAALQPLTFPLYPFVKFNSYRLAPNQFFVVGITSQVARAFDVPVYDCQWRKKPWTKAPDYITRAEMIYIRADENRMPYVPSIVNCTFDTPVGADGDGGLLSISLSIRPKKDTPSGLRTMGVHQESKGEFLKFNETVTRFQESGPASLPYKYAFCGPPMHGKIKADWILSWMTYHFRLYGGTEGKVRFLFYNNGGLKDEGRKVLEPFIKAGVVEIIDVFDEWQYPAHYHSQVLFINDCLQRTRYMSQWTLFHDFDEFLYVPPPNSLDSLLKKYEDQPWLTFASLPASYDYCTDRDQVQMGQESWPVEKMLWVQRQPECRYKNNPPDPYVCPGPLGRRKYMVNPRKVLASGVHATALNMVPGGGHRSQRDPYQSTSLSWSACVIQPFLRQNCEFHWLG